MVLVDSLAKASGNILVTTVDMDILEQLWLTSLPDNAGVQIVWPSKNRLCSGTYGWSRPLQCDLPEYRSAHRHGHLSLSVFLLHLSIPGKLFKDTTGYGVSEYIRLARLNYAKSLLCSTAQSISCIAQESGLNKVQLLKNRREWLPASVERGDMS